MDYRGDSDEGVPGAVAQSTPVALGGAPEASPPQMPHVVMMASDWIVGDVGARTDPSPSEETRREREAYMNSIVPKWAMSPTLRARALCERTGEALHCDGPERDTPLR